jgi:hypothetical protein
MFQVATKKGLPMTEANSQVRELFMGAMPERLAELDVVLEQISFQTASDRPAFHLEAIAVAGHGLVVFTPRTLEQVWLIAYMAWQCMHEQSGFVVGFLDQGRPYDLTAPDVGDAGQRARARVSELGEALRRLRDAETEQAEWPADVPIPNPTAVFEDTEDQAAFELACFALTFVLLHECYHALQRIAGVDYQGSVEELACDAYAAHFIIDHAHQYSVGMGYDKHQQQTVLDKRAIGTFLGLVLMLETTEIGLRTPTETHPAWIERVRAITAIIDPIVSHNCDFWVYATSVMLSRLRREGLDIGSMPYKNVRALFNSALERYAEA